MATVCRIKKITIDNSRSLVLAHMPVDWEAEVDEKEIKKGNGLTIEILGRRVYAYVRSGLEGTVIAFEVGRIVFYSDIPVPEDFH